MKQLPTTESAVLTGAICPFEPMSMSWTQNRLPTSSYISLSNPIYKILSGGGWRGWDGQTTPLSLSVWSARTGVWHLLWSAVWCPVIRWDMADIIIIIGLHQYNCIRCSVARITGDGLDCSQCFLTSSPHHSSSSNLSEMVLLVSSLTWPWSTLTMIMSSTITSSQHWHWEHSLYQESWAGTQSEI